MQNEENQQPVVAPVNINTSKLSQESVTSVNGAALAIASLFSVISMFAAIASFTKGEWIFRIPLMGTLSVTGADTLFVTSVVALVFSVISLISVRKITDAEQLKKTYSTWANVYSVLSVVFVSAVIATILYALFTIGSKSVEQKDLWLSGFLPALIIAGVSVGMTFVFKTVAKGKTTMLSMINFIIVGIATLGLLLTTISIFVNHYGNKSSRGSSYSDYLQDLLD